MTASAPSLAARMSYLASASSGTHAAYRTERLSREEIRALDIDDWDRLARNSVEQNPFLSPRFVLSALDAYPELSGSAALAVRNPCDGTLVGLFPFVPHRPAPLLPAMAARARLHLYQVQGTPLVSADHARPVLEAFLVEATAALDIFPRWVFPHVPLEGAFARMLKQVAQGQGFETLGTRAYERSVLERSYVNFPEHADAIIGKKRKKDIERNLRRLSDLGAVRLERATEPSLVAQRIEEFLTLEAAGWKGETGTALLSSPTDAQFARTAFGHGPGLPIASVDGLLLDDKPIAMSINISVGGTLFTPKCAFDETYRKFGPGLALEYKIIECFYDDHALGSMDSATTVDGHVISSFWNGSVPMGTLVLGPKGTLTGIFAGFEDTEYHARRFAKKLLGRG